MICSFRVRKKKKASEQLEEDNKELLTCMKESLEGKVKDVKISGRLKKASGLHFHGRHDLHRDGKVLNAMPAQEKVKAQRVLELNAEHPVFEKLRSLYPHDKDRLKTYAELLYDQALLIEGMPLRIRWPSPRSSAKSCDGKLQERRKPMNYGTQPPYSVPGQVPPPPQAAPQAYPPIAGYSASETPPAGYSYPVPPAARKGSIPCSAYAAGAGQVPVQPYLGYSQAAPVMPFYQAASAPMPASYAVPPAYPAPLYAPAPQLCHKGRKGSAAEGATRSLNRLGLVVLGQTGLAMLWGALFGVLMVLCGVNALLDSSAQLWLSAVAVPLSTALPFCNLSVCHSC